MAERHSSSALDSSVARTVRQDTRAVRQATGGHRITKPMHRELKHALRVCNRCAHGDPVAWHEVEAAVGSISAFLTSHPLPPAIG